VGDWANLQREVVAFGEVYLSLPEPQDAALERSRRPYSRQVSLKDDPLWVSESLEEVALPSQELLQEVQREWRAAIQPFLSPHADGNVGPLNFMLAIGRIDDDAGGRTRAFVRRDDTSDPKTLVPLALLLGSYAHRLGTCQAQGCGRWFVGDRKNQRFCSRTCLNRESLRAFRERGTQKAKIQSDQVGSAADGEAQSSGALVRGTAGPASGEFEELMAKVLPHYKETRRPDPNPVSGYVVTGYLPPPKAGVRGGSATSRKAREQQPRKGRRRRIKK
jgi:CGNR zinc finger protein